MMKKTILTIDRNYSYKFMNSETFDVIVVCLTEQSYYKHKSAGLCVVGCFEAEYEDLDVANFPGNYLDHSFDSDRFLVRYNYEQRLEILGKEITFWKKILDRYHPDCIINEIVTMEWTEVMYIEARKRNIPYYTWGIVPFAPKDIWISEPPYDTRMYEGFWQSIEITEDDKRKALSYIRDVREKNHKPFYICGKKKSAFSELIKALILFLPQFYCHTLSRLKKKFVYESYYEIWKSHISRLWALTLRKYDRFDIRQDFEYFFYPLHYEPEAAVEYCGYYYNDQAMLIGRIAHSLKLNQILIVKEHPQQEGALLTSNYLRLKKKYSNLMFLPGHISAYDIYPHIQALITLNGTAGFESWICKRSVIVFGEVFYKDFPGIIACNNFKQLYDIIRHDKLIRPTDEDIITYISKIEHILTDTFPYIIDGKYDETNLRSLENQLINKMLGI